MSAFAIASIVIGGLLLLVGFISVVGSFRVVSEGRGRERAVLALHEVGKAGFWLALGAFFLGSALLDDVEGLRWFLLVPIALAGLRLIAASLLAR